MAQTESKIRLIFDGAERGVVAAAAKARTAIKGLDDDNSKLNKSADKAGTALLNMGKGMLALGSAGSAVQVVGGVAGALTQLAPAALLLPGALLGGAAAMGTFKIATAGFGDALKAGLSGDMKKFTKDTKDMAPAMLDAVKAVVAFKPQIDGLKKAVQSKFWDGFNVGIKQLGDNYLPILQKRLPNIAAQFNLVGRGIFEAFNSRDVMSDFDSLLENTADSLKGMGPAVGNLGAGIVKLAELGSRRFRGLGEAVDGVAEKFRNWVAQGVESGSLDKLITNALNGLKSLGRTAVNIGSILGSVFTGLGGVVASPLAKIEELTGRVADFLKTASAQEGLQALGSALSTISDQVGRVLDVGLRELAPTLVKLAPVAQEVATTLGDLLVSALETLGPIIRGIADVFNAFPGSAGLATVAVVGFVAAIKTIKAANAVTELLGLGDNIFSIGAKAKGAEGKVRGFSGALGAIKGAIAVGAVAALAVEMDKVNAASEQGNLSGWNGELHDIVRILSGDWGNPLADINAQLDQTSAKWKAGQAPVQQWALAVGQAASDAGISIQNFFRGLVGLPPLPPIKIDANTDPATGKVDDWVGGVSRRSATAGLDADPAKANAALGGWVGHAVATVGTAHLSAEPGSANATVGGWVGGVSRTRGTAHLDAEPGGANATLGGWQGSANRTTGQAHLSAEDSMANRVAQGFVNSWAGKVITMSIHAIASVFGATGGAVTGGVIVPGFAPGGPVRGPGTGTSDQVIARLSNGEYVMTAEQVRAAGGFGGMAAIASTLTSARSPMASTARAALRPVPAPAASSSSGGTVVQFAGNTSDALATVIMQMIRTNKIQIRAA